MSNVVDDNDCGGGGTDECNDDDDDEDDEDDDNDIDDDCGGGSMDQYDDGDDVDDDNDCGGGDGGMDEYEYDVDYGSADLTFCDFSATMSTNWKSYMPRATSYAWFTSTKNSTYLSASSHVTCSPVTPAAASAEEKANPSYCPADTGQ